MSHPSQMQVKLHLWLNLNERRPLISNKLDGRLSLLWWLQKLNLLTSQSALHRNDNIWESLAGWRRKAYSPLHRAPEARSSCLMNETIRSFFKWDKQPSGRASFYLKYLFLGYCSIGVQQGLVAHLAWSWSNATDSDACVVPQMWVPAHRLS